ncbi:MAG TPA: hypothetical protein VGG39_06090 [Polyangiaceae bacterium]
MTTLFSPDHAVSVRQAAWAIGGLYTVAFGGLGWLIVQMHSLGVDLGAAKEHAASIDKRLDGLDGQTKNMQTGLEVLRTSEISALRERLARAEQKLDCVTCAAATVVPVASLPGARER